MLIVSQIIGVAAVALYLLSYQLKKRGQIVWVTCVSNALYVLQYLLLGAFSGAALDLLSTVSSFFAGKKNAPGLRRHMVWIVPASFGVILAVGLFLAAIQKDWIELFAVAGALLQNGGLWFEDEQTIRKFGLACAPCWLIYNFISQAYGAALGSVLAIASTLIAMVRYRKKKPDSLFGRIKKKVS